jgi:hypothetical protein
MVSTQSKGRDTRPPVFFDPAGNGSVARAQGCGSQSWPPPGATAVFHCWFFRECVCREAFIHRRCRSFSEWLPFGAVRSRNQPRSVGHVPRQYSFNDKTYVRCFVLRSGVQGPGQVIASLKQSFCCPHHGFGPRRPSHGRLAWFVH